MIKENLTNENEEIEAYQRLREHLDQLPVGYPKTKSGVEIRILRRLFTPEEARIASMLKFAWKNLEPLEQIHARLEHLGYSREELEHHLDNMAKKGAIMYLRKNNVKTYGNALFAVGMFEFQVNKLTKEFMEDMHQYWQGEFATDMLKVPIPQLRTIPVGIEIDRDLSVIKYDNMKKLVENTEGPFAVFNCVCRQAKDLFNDPCKKTKRREVCMSFGHTAQLYIDMGWGRQISKKEVFEILKKNEEDGLIFQPSNSQQIDFVCSCCTCCCEGLSKIKKLPNAGRMVRTNYYAEIEQDLCGGCGTCIDRCQMDAINLEDNISSIDPNRCIGCGNCVIACPSDAIKLRAKEKIRAPPSTCEELYEVIFERRKHIIEKKKQRVAKK